MVRIFLQIQLKIKSNMDHVSPSLGHIARGIHNSRNRRRGIAQTKN